MRPPLGRLEREALVLWNTVGGNARFTELAAASLYLNLDDFEALRGLVFVIRDEQGRTD